MADEAVLGILKINLQISTDKLDEYLSSLVSAAREYIKTEGIVLLPQAQRGRANAPFSALGLE